MILDNQARRQKRREAKWLDIVDTVEQAVTIKERARITKDLLSSNAPIMVIIIGVSPIMIARKPVRAPDVASGAAILDTIPEPAQI